jgi:hypothetical protein
LIDQIDAFIGAAPLSASDNPAFDAMGMHFNDSKAMTVEEIKDAISRYACKLNIQRVVLPSLKTE